MEQLPKLPYLSKDDKGYKLRRRVPDEFRSLVGKTEWVERVGGLPWQQVKERQSLFAVRTNAALSAARAQLAGHASRHGSSSANAPGFKERPSRHDIEQIALAYFLERDRALRSADGYYVDPHSENYREHLEDAGAALRDAKLAAHDRGWNDLEDRRNQSFPTTLRLLARHGFLDAEQAALQRGKKIDPAIAGDPLFKELAKLVSRADVEIAMRVYGAYRSGEEPRVIDAFFAPMVLPGAAPQPLPKAKEHTLGQLIQSFLDRKAREVGTSRLSQFNVPTRAMVEELGPSLPIRNITRAHCQAVADLLVRIPSHAAQHYKGMTLNAASEAHKLKHGSYPARFDEAEKGLATVKAVMAWAVDLEWIEATPAANVKVVRPARTAKKSEEADRGYHPFTVDELHAIFTAPLFTGSVDDEYRFNSPGPALHRRSRYWAPLIALWTGLRLNEILQLEKGDVREEAGIVFLSVNDREEMTYDPAVFQKRLKTKHSVRDVPIRDELVRLGLVDWVQKRPPGRLFPEAAGSTPERPSIVFSKRFATFLRSRGVWASRTKVFHSFRNNFTDALRDGDVRVEFREALLGWSDQAKMDGKYGTGHKLKQLKREIDKAVYDGLDLSHLGI